MKRRVLVVEDNADMRETLRAYLVNDGYEVSAVGSTEEGIDVIDEQPIDIGLIDINLPGKSGYDMIEYIRDSHDIPLIALTARDSVGDKVRGFDVGLNDYLVKPFDLQELTARMRVHLMRSGVDAMETDIKIGVFAISPRRQQFTVKNKPVELTQLEFRIMHLLMLNRESVVKLDDLINYAWGEDSSVINPPIRIHIANLRKKIGDTTFQIIKTIPGTGYILQGGSANG